MDRGGWQAVVHGVIKSWTWLKWLSTEGDLELGGTFHGALWPCGSLPEENPQCSQESAWSLLLEWTQVLSWVTCVDWWHHPSPLLPTSSPLPQYLNKPQKSHFLCELPSTHRNFISAASREQTSWNLGTHSLQDGADANSKPSIFLKATSNMETGITKKSMWAILRYHSSFGRRWLQESGPPAFLYVLFLACVLQSE